MIVCISYTGEPTLLLELSSHRAGPKGLSATGCWLLKCAPLLTVLAVRDKHARAEVGGRG